MGVRGKVTIDDRRACISRHAHELNGRERRTRVSPREQGIDLKINNEARHGGSNP